jgi:hypothetical protein
MPDAKLEECIQGIETRAQGTQEEFYLQVIFTRAGIDLRLFQETMQWKFY